ncbi:23S rRNA pseudouridine(955/2504/2580) synthase RluC [Psychromonas antarctica]|jgi:23S rRNA pseudouridine955/2504/2580 synthase|uniref:23S rRNA pseudouridine(955/2504/2580) synthase RluC n=1 Tax=Psychromonas antarctica TaxID=67573 RepID=UPI001EE865EA|nr:23S rRNA pseudouridine(955/2504/2580) synthase RluC [Psychromonas antarctica]MCG6200482.1 23S rRNA pseudouridine(955/2504/2580) synthase RluC [Psychromonas antarctica]
MEQINHLVRILEVTQENAQQRIDNFLRLQLKGVPKSMIYRIVRKGEVRVNKKRIKADYKLQSGDLVRIPPVHVDKDNPLPSPKLNVIAQLESLIVYEDDALIILNKPPGLAVHGGSGLDFGAIEALRSLRPEARFLELVHRLDRATSGCLLIAKKRSMLRALHEQLRSKTMNKQYLALVKGSWDKSWRSVKEPLLKNAQNSIVKVSSEGKASETRFKIMQRYQGATLVEASPVTGRTHQIRVHTACKGHNIAGDDRYGDDAFSAEMKKLGLNRLFLHAAHITFYHPVLEKQMTVSAPLCERLSSLLEKLQRS